LDKLGIEEQMFKKKHPSFTYCLSMKSIHITHHENHTPCWDIWMYGFQAAIYEWVWFSSCDIWMGMVFKLRYMNGYGFQAAIYKWVWFSSCDIEADIVNLFQQHVCIYLDIHEVITSRCTTHTSIFHLYCTVCSCNLNHVFSNMSHEKNRGGVVIVIVDETFKLAVFSIKY
jgi:hypothetical protein